MCYLYSSPSDRMQNVKGFVLEWFDLRYYSSFLFMSHTVFLLLTTHQTSLPEFLHHTTVAVTLQQLAGIRAQAGGLNSLIIIHSDSWVSEKYVCL